MDAVKQASHEDSKVIVLDTSEIFLRVNLDQLEIYKMIDPLFKNGQKSFRSYCRNLGWNFDLESALVAVNSNRGHLNKCKLTDDFFYFFEGENKSNHGEAVLYGCLKPEFIGSRYEVGNGSGYMLLDYKRVKERQQYPRRIYTGILCSEEGISASCSTEFQFDLIRERVEQMIEAFSPKVFFVSGKNKEVGSKYFQRVIKRKA